MATLRLSVRTGDEDSEPTGRDSVVQSAPPELYLWIGERLVPHITRLAAFLKRRSEESAASLGERLHHAEWSITTDPDEVESLGMQHDCALCRSGVDQALARLRDKPREPMLVGVCFWAGPL